MEGKGMHNSKNVFLSLIEIFQMRSRKVNIYVINYFNEIVGYTMETKKYRLNCMFF